MNMSEQLSAQLMDKVGPAWQSHSRIRTCRRRLSWLANRVPCSVTSLACGPWLLGPICQWLWGWAQLLGIRWGHRWCFPPKAKALLPTTCGTVDARRSHTKPRSPIGQARTALDLNRGVPVNLTCKLTRKQQTVKFKSVGWISKSLLRGVLARPCR